VSRQDPLRTAGRWVLGTFLLAAGTAHFVATDEFGGQVPTWLPVEADLVVQVSGVVELGLGASLLLARPRHRPRLGWVVAAFFVAVFPGNLWQWWQGTDSFGLDTDRGRAIRLLFQPALVLWALWCTRAWADRPRRD